MHLHSAHHDPAQATSNKNKKMYRSQKQITTDFTIIIATQAVVGNKIQQNNMRLCISPRQRRKQKLRKQKKKEMYRQ